MHRRGQIHLPVIRACSLVEPPAALLARVGVAVLNLTQFANTFEARNDSLFVSASQLKRFGLPKLHEEAAHNLTLSSFILLQLTGSRTT